MNDLPGLSKDGAGNRKSVPVPSAADPKKDWTVVPSNAGVVVDRSRAVVAAPTGVDVLDRQARNLAMVEIRYGARSIKSMPSDVDLEIYKACETLRMHKRASTHSPRPIITRAVAPKLPPVDELAKKYAAGDDAAIKAAVVDLIESFPSHERDTGCFLSDGDYSRVINAAHKAWDSDSRMRKLDAAYHLIRDSGIYRRKNPGAKAAMDLAHKITYSLSPPPPPPGATSDTNAVSIQPPQATMRQPQEVTTQQATASLEEASNFADVEEAKQILRQQIQKNREDGDQSGWESIGGKDGEALWHPMNIVTPPLVNRLNGRMKAPGYSPTDKGAVFKYPHRWCGDKAVFATKTIREGGCAVLIDCSSSMQITMEDVAEIMQYLPGSIVAGYHRVYSYKDGARLTILARNGMWVAERDMVKPGGYNACDGLALRWLAEQKGPRYWVSDGYVNGLADAGWSALYADCMGICIKHRILRLEDMEECREFALAGYNKRNIGR